MQIIYVYIVTSNFYRKNYKEKKSNKVSFRENFMSDISGEGIKNNPPLRAFKYLLAKSCLPVRREWGELMSSVPNETI